MCFKHERQHLGATLKIGVDAFGLYDVADDAVQVGAGRLGGVADPVTLEDLVIGNPDAAARARSRAAEVGGFLDD